MDPINDYALLIPYNFIHPKNPQNPFLCYIVAPLILQNSKNLTQPIKFLKQLPHPTSFTYILIHTHSNYPILEVTPPSIHVSYEHMSTNHFE
ncbi:carcinine hydrolase/isopenicillin-N N-acyltransferase family protein, partial [Staphylococcus epidermidis]|uniref:carcinine hydrolase/isopenicillin-N N-acyltransferase family protein n=1 Tax=Staphylococcus epidermidis TaxID=1282 RepID=UPI0021B18244